MLTYQTGIHSWTVHLLIRFISTFCHLLLCFIILIFFSFYALNIQNKNCPYLYFVCKKPWKQSCYRRRPVLQTVPYSEHHRRHPRQCGLLGYDNTRGTSHNKRRCSIVSFEIDRVYLGQCVGRQFVLNFNIIKQETLFNHLARV